MSVDGGSDVMRQLAEPKQDERKTDEVIIHYEIAPDSKIEREFSRGFIDLISGSAHHIIMEYALNVH